MKKDKWALWRTPYHLYEPHTKPMKFLLATYKFNLLDLYTYSKNETEIETLGQKIYHRWFKLAAKERYVSKL